MRYKTFGTQTGLLVSEVALGSGMFGTTWGYGAGKEEVQTILRAYAEAGGNFIDTADNYQWGVAEELIGDFIGSNRHDFVISSKYSRGVGANPSLGMLGNHRKAMVQSVEESLKRLKTDRIDLYFVHFEDYVTPVDEIIRGLDDLVKAGKIIYGGFSNFPAWRIATAATTANLRGTTPVAGIQIEYSLLQRTTERELLPMADAFGLGVMAWSPLAGGLLTGKYRNGQTGRAISLKESVLHTRSEKQERILDTLLAIAEELGDVNAGQVAIAWVKAKGVFPIIGPRTRGQLDDNLAAITIDLSEAHIQRLDDASKIALGYPQELNTAADQRAVMTGNRSDRIDFPKYTVR